MNAFGNKLSNTPSAQKAVSGILPLLRQLSKLTAAQSGDGSLSRTMMNVMVCLHESGSRPVPHIARNLGVGRQHVQRTVNDLLARELVARRPNPDHQRSWLIDLSPHGQFMVERSFEDQAALFLQLSDKLSVEDLKACHRVLAHLKQAMEPHQTPAKSTPVINPAPTPQPQLEPEPQQTAKVIEWNTGGSSGIGLRIQTAVPADLLNGGSADG